MPKIPFHPPGVTYNGLHSTEHPTTSQVAADLAATKAHFDHARTYYPQYGGGAVDVGKVASEANLDLLLGLFLFEGHDDWTDDNYRRFVTSAVPRGNIAGILVGNEDPQMMDLIVTYLEQSNRDFSQIPVGTSQKTDFWLADPRAAQLVSKVDFIGVNIYPAWDWSAADRNNQPREPGNPSQAVTPEAGFNSFTATYGQVRSKYPNQQIVVTETGWPTTFGPVGAQQFQIGIDNARDYLQRVTGWARTEQVVVYIHNMYDDQYGVDASSPFNYHFGLIDNTGKPKGVLF
jgi:exo-beta-1,3-glucanase (GH17 family)